MNYSLALSASASSSSQRGRPSDVAGKKDETGGSSLRVRAQLDPQWHGTKVNLETTPYLMSLIDDRFEEWFALLARQWINETGGYSSVDKKYDHPAINVILNMDKDRVVPLIIQQLSFETYHWFPALKILLGGFDPTPVNYRGDVMAMMDAWTNWGRERGYLN